MSPRLIVEIPIIPRHDTDGALFVDSTSRHMGSFRSSVRQYVNTITSLTAVWYRYYGFISGGNLCNYGGEPDQIADPKDLVQFIPRAFVFITILALYSKLFQFLRRPDAIHVRSFVSGGSTGVAADERRGSVMQRLSKKVKGEVKDDRPPWEQLEFVTMGSLAEGRLHTEASLPRQSISHEAIHMPLPYPTATSLTRASSSSSVNQGRDWEQRGSDAETLVTPPLGPVNHVRVQALSPVLSDGAREFENPQETKDQTMAEFFQEHQVGNGTISEHDGPQMSATEYFNRQASLLMLYFPLAVSIHFAWLMVVSAGLLRIISSTDIRHDDLWTTKCYTESGICMVRLISGVYRWTCIRKFQQRTALNQQGLAEYMVKRRVRRKMPDRL